VAPFQRVVGANEALRPLGHNCRHRSIVKQARDGAGKRRGIVRPDE
jgi:YD repeat-containing protein